MKILLPILTFGLALTFFAASCDDEDGTTIQLPANVQSYLDTNHPNAEIEESEADTLCTGTAVYEVELEVNDDEELELTFDTEGSLLSTSMEIPASQLPAAVTAAISANFGGYSVEEAESLDLPGGGNQFEVELKGSNVKEVLFNADGTVVCEQVETEDDGE